MRNDFNDNGAETTTYARFFLGDEDEVAVESRDIKKLNIPENSHGFYFYDQTSIVINGETLEGEEKNYSKTYIVAEKLMSLADVIKEVPNSDILQANMKENGWDYVARTSLGTFQQVDGDVIVINSAKEQLYPVAKAAKPSAKASPQT